MQPQPFFHNSQQQGDPIDFHAVRHPLRHGIPGRGHQRLQLDQNRPRSLETRDHHRAGAVLRTLGQKELGGISHLVQPRVFHLKHADLVRGPEPVLHRTQDPVGVALLPFEIQHGVHDMLQKAGARNGAFLRDVADEKDRNPAALGKPHQLGGHLLHLADAAGRRGDLVRVDRLDRVYDDRGWLQVLNRLEDFFERGFGQDIEGGTVDAQPFSPHLHLPGRFFAGHVENPLS